MDLIVNTTRINHWSRGVQRYFSTVMQNLNWGNDVKIFQPRIVSFLQRPVELAFRGSQNSLIWTPCQRGPLNAHNHIVTVHDCINIEYVIKNKWRKDIKQIVIQKTFDNATCIVAISSSTRCAILRNYDVDPSKLTVIKSSCEVDSTLKSCRDRLIGRPAVQNDSSECKPFILMVTNSLPHKNTVDACQALVHSQANRFGIGLRVVGSLNSEAYEVCLRNNFPVTIEQSVTDIRLAELYTNCLLFFSPSLSEGHNLPIAEALYFGSNVLCSDIDAHREFYEGSVEFFDPLCLGEMIAALDKAIFRSGPWFTCNPRADRTQGDVAKDYRKIFESLC